MWEWSGRRAELGLEREQIRGANDERAPEDARSFRARLAK